ncbi:hypothetical protein BU25DRAFT_407766 [Macroventuria anomochaeta]|uniref:Uncharacterized protein n=1 Tax=Macroventuria anomochaeta TaxID=301207 RepID=A0ACB6SCK4_9PLEO|nr:uncharacterized protein BU25DRAFT_407766 [Macroventuria anomochaeta]KAF2631242.1 hypothetical protein BU25DRAFT_407766 [Macroventuria anomochaeta]
MKSTHNTARHTLALALAVQQHTLTATKRKQRLPMSLFESFFHHCSNSTPRRLDSAAGTSHSRGGAYHSPVGPEW